MPNSAWLADENARAATERILDGARIAFASRGVSKATMDDIAAAAECSRGTLYRYFDNRDDLRLAFIHRETRRINENMVPLLRACETIDEMLVEAVVRSVDAVRADPVVRPFFDPEALGVTNRLAGGSDLLFTEMTRWITTLLETAPDRERLRSDIDAGEAAEWIVRTILSLLSVAGPVARSPAAERAYLRRWFLPAFLAPQARITASS